MCTCNIMAVIVAMPWYARMRARAQRSTNQRLAIGPGLAGVKSSSCSEADAAHAQSNPVQFSNVT
jgi:hypothetical protein